jgi:hypothetical protein
MSQHAAHPADPSDASTGELVAQLSEQTSRLIRDELRLAQLELTAKGKKAGLGAGLFGGAGAIAFFGAGSMVAAAILGLAVAISAWLAALLVGLALFAVAGLAALVGKREVTQATPPMPTEAVEGMKQDLRTLKSGSPS